MSEQNTGNLANIYRPKTFKEVVGQDLAVSALKRIAHADGISVRSVLLKGSWGSGKCVHPDTVVRTSNGLRLAKNINRRTEFSIVDRPNSFVGADVNSETNVIVIKTARGKVVKVTPNHPVMVWTGSKYDFVRADALNIGDCLVEDVTPQETIKFDEWAYFVGLLLGDGVLTQNNSNSISFITTDKQLEDFVESFCKENCYYYCKQTVLRGNSKPQTVFSFNRFSTVTLKCQKEGLLGHNADTKCLPLSFWDWSFSSQVSLLQGIMDTDGSCNSDGSVELGLNSITLLTDLAHVAQSLGISVRISKRVREYKRKDGTTGVSYRMHFGRHSEQVDFSRLFRLQRKLDSVRKIVDVSQSKKFRFNGMSSVISNFIKENKISISNSDRRTLNTNFGNGEMSYQACLRWQQYLLSRGYEVQFVLPNTLPDFVESLSVETVHYTVDLQCENEPIFYTSGIITHNTTTARIFGRALNCEHFKENDDVCNECPKCKDAMTRTSQLYMELDATSVGNVESIRNISERLSIVPNGRRLVVVDEIHAASSAALNALLKLIEDGVPNTMFLFATTEDILPTIQSRSLCIDIGTIPLNVLSARIREIAQSRGTEISEQNLAVLAMKSQGHMRDALQLLQLYELAGERGLDSSYFKFKSFIINAFSKNPKQDPKEILMDILKYPTADIKMSIGTFIRSIFTAEPNTVEYKLAVAGLGKTLFGYFFTPTAQQALRSEVGTEILLRAFLEKATAKPRN